MRIYFSDFFDITAQVLENYGAFDVSLVNDLPLFIDPFLLFRSNKPEYQALHAGIIEYVAYLRECSMQYQGNMDLPRLKHLYLFKEVRQNWLGFSKSGNSGSALGLDFAIALDKALYTIFPDFGKVQSVTSSSHLEKVCLVSEGVGRDGLSDFTTNLIKEYLLEYTQTFARTHIDPARLKSVNVPRVKFDYNSEQWVSAIYDLPRFRGDFVLLTPKDILTKDDMWINRPDLYDKYADIALAYPDDQLRYQINNYFYEVLPANATKVEREAAMRAVVKRYPEMLDYYIREKEETGDQAVAKSADKVVDTETLFIQQVRSFVDNQLVGTGFYEQGGDTLTGALKRTSILKRVIEEDEGYKVFYLDNEPIHTQDELQVLFRLVWHATLPGEEPKSQKEQSNGRVEFKLASNPQLDKALKELAVAIKEKDQDKLRLMVVIATTPVDLAKTMKYVNEHGLTEGEHIIIINAQSKEAATHEARESPSPEEKKDVNRKAVILTALKHEYEAVRYHLKEPAEEEHAEGTIYERGIFEAPSGSWEVLIAEIGAGNDNAGVEAERAIRHMQPSVILFVGVAGGVKSVELGDIVVGDRVAGYESGKDEEDFSARPDVGESHYNLVARARAERKKDDWLRRLSLAEGEKRPEVQIGTIAAGGKVVASACSVTAKFLKTNYNDTLAVEMEGRGFLRATRANPSVKSLIVRGISDLLDDKTEEADKSWQPKASRNASAFAFEILAKLSLSSKG